MSDQPTAMGRITHCDLIHDELLEALKAVMQDAIPPQEYVYLRNGIGIHTPKGRALLKAREVILRATRGSAPLNGVSG